LLKMDRNTPNSLRRIFGRSSSKFTQFLLRRRNAASIARFASEIDAERRRRCFNRRTTAGELWKLPRCPIRNRLAIGKKSRNLPRLRDARRSAQPGVSTELQILPLLRRCFSATPRSANQDRQAIRLFSKHPRTPTVFRASQQPRQQPGPSEATNRGTPFRMAASL
jgi:hypothetical protein